jgi:GntR family transcriptional regulator
MAVHKHDTAQQLIRENILARLEPGQPLDSERRLAEQLGMSRVTIRRALDHLEQEGLVTRVHGSGTYKTDPLVIGKVLQPLSYPDDMRQRGLVPSFRVLQLDTPEAGDSVAAALSIDTSDKVLSVWRLLLADGEPMALERSYLPLEPFPGIEHEDFTISIYDILRTKYGREIWVTKQKIRAKTLQPEEAGLLGTHAGAAALVAYATTSDHYGTPMEHIRATFRADRYDIDLTIRANR